MFLEICKLCEGLFALYALERVFSSVDSHVNHQIAICSKQLVADFTLMWLCTRVSEVVCLESRILVKGLVALSTLEGLLSRVDSNMYLKVISSCTAEGTLLASERPFPRMDQFVSF